jgi:AcrR family transcriptional regulator
MLDVAEVLFQRHGYAGVTVEDVTNSLGVKKPNLYNHFRDKSDLYVAVRLRRLNSLSTSLALALEPGPPFGERLEAVIAALLRNPFFLSALVNRYSETFLSADTRDLLFARAFGAVYEPMMRLLNEGISAGEVPLSREHLPFAYEALIALVAHFGATAPLENRSGDAEALAARIGAFFLHGVGAAESP